MEDDRERQDGGEYKETTTPDNALDVLKQAQKPFLTAKEVADKLDCSPDTARRKLSKLDDVNGDGTIRRQDVGSSAVVWWLPD